MPLRIGSRLFSPRPLTTGLTLVLVIALLGLGRWQLQRAEEKHALYAAFDAGSDATQVLEADTPALPRYQHVSADGTYDSAHQILIDNISNSRSEAGYYVITPFDLIGGGVVLVNRGWVPLGQSRAVKPDVSVPGKRRRITGRTDVLPRAGIQMGHAAPLAPPFPVVAYFPTRPEILALLRESPGRGAAGGAGNSGTGVRSSGGDGAGIGSGVDARAVGAADLLLLDPGERDGYLRDWHPPGLPPIRHVAYAVQWFAIAAALVVIYLVTNFRPASRSSA